MAAADTDIVIEHPNREKPESKATRAVMVILLVLTAVLMLIVQIGGWNVAKNVAFLTFAIVIVYLVLVLYQAGLRSAEQAIDDEIIERADHHQVRDQQPHHPPVRGARNGIEAFLCGLKLRRQIGDPRLRQLPIRRQRLFFARGSDGVSNKLPQHARQGGPR